MFATKIHTSLPRMQNPPKTWLGKVLSATVCRFIFLELWFNLSYIRNVVHRTKKHSTTSSAPSMGIQGAILHPLIPSAWTPFQRMNRNIGILMKSTNLPNMNKQIPIGLPKPTKETEYVLSWVENAAGSNGNLKLLLVKEWDKKLFTLLLRLRNTIYKHCCILCLKYLSQVLILVKRGRKQ